MDLQADPKAGERTYYERLSADGRRHAQAKPFSDARCAHYLSDMGALLMLLEAPPRRVLDLGCGTGWTSVILARAGYTVTGVDISPDAVALAEETAQAEGLANVTFRVGDYERAAAESGAFDYVLFYDALHHAEDEAAAVAAAYGALKAGGALIAFEPGRGHGGSAASRRAVAEFGVHEKDMPPAKIAALGRAAGFREAVFLPTPHEIARTIYRRDFHAAVARGGGRLVAEKLWGAFRTIQRLLNWRQARGGMTMLWK